LLLLLLVLLCLRLLRLLLRLRLQVEEDEASVAEGVAVLVVKVPGREERVRGLNVGEALAAHLPVPGLQGGAGAGACDIRGGTFRMAGTRRRRLARRSRRRE
jgi:hypothetical protein